MEDKPFADTLGKEAILPSRWEITTTVLLRRIQHRKWKETECFTVLSIYCVEFCLVTLAVYNPLVPRHRGAALWK